MDWDFILFVLTFVALGLALDFCWDFEFRAELHAFRQTPRRLRYTKLLFPRIIFIIGATVLMAYGAYETPPIQLPIIIGGIVFGVATFGPHIYLFAKSRRQK